MKTSFSKSLGSLFACCVAVRLMVVPLAADEAQFFRIVGPTATTITAFTPDGYVTWTNAQIGANYQIQTARRLGSATNWVEYVQVPVSNTVVTQRLYDPKPPSGMVFVPAGSFTMGNCMDPGEGYSDELPLHTVYVSAFYIDQYDVTKALWDTVRQWAISHRYMFDHPGLGKAANHPVQTISWYDAVKWCNARSEREGKTPAYYTDAGLRLKYQGGQVSPYVKWTSGYRLPTGAEWEKAARGGVGGQRFPWGNTISWGQANYYADPLSAGGDAYDVNPTSRYHPIFNDGVYPFTSPVGYFAPNGYGLYDMAGNVWQWCWDWYGLYESAPQSDPRGPASGSFRTVRGGTYLYDGKYCRAAAHAMLDPSISDNSVGFRSVLDGVEP
jgi:formylglycine-generating enzyme